MSDEQLETGQWYNFHFFQSQREQLMVGGEYHGSKMVGHRSLVDISFYYRGRGSGKKSPTRLRKFFAADTIVSVERIAAPDGSVSTLVRVHTPNTPKTGKGDGDTEAAETADTSVDTQTEEVTMNVGGESAESAESTETEQEESSPVPVAPPVVTAPITGTVTGRTKTAAPAATNPPKAAAATKPTTTAPAAATTTAPTKPAASTATAASAAKAPTMRAAPPRRLPSIDLDPEGPVDAEPAAAPVKAATKPAAKPAAAAPTKVAAVAKSMTTIDSNDDENEFMPVSAKTASKTGNGTRKPRLTQEDDAPSEMTEDSNDPIDTFDDQTSLEEA